MSLSILEVLENAEFNLRAKDNFDQREIGLNQLSNAIYLLREKDYGIYDTFNEAEIPNSTL